MINPNQIPKEYPDPRLKPGQDLIMTGFLARQGTVLAVQKKKSLLLETLPADFLEEAEKLGPSGEEEEILDRYLEAHPQIVSWPVCEGGVLKALWDMGKAHEVGLDIYLKRLPIRQETVEICEVLDLNLYQLLCGGCRILGADNGNDVLFALSRMGIRACLIGKCTDSKDRVILNEDSRRFLNRPEPDELLKLEQA